MLIGKAIHQFVENLAAECTAEDMVARKAATLEIIKIHMSTLAEV
jgi:hypothetical protein